MTPYLIAIPVAVLVLGLILRAWIARRGGDLLTAQTRRNLTGFVILATLLAALAALAVALNPTTTDTLVVSMVRSLPSLLLAGIIVILAILVGRIAGALTARALRGWSAVLADRIGRFTTAAIVAIGTIIALDQLGVSTELIVIMITAVIGALALAAALSFGLGTVPLARQIAAGRHVSDRYDIGDRVVHERFSGRIVELGISSTRIETDDGEFVEVPNGLFLEEPVTIRPSGDRIG